MLYNRLTDMTDTALSWNKENRVVAFLWHQGECDSVENPDYDVEKRYAVHKQNLYRQLVDFRSRYGEKIPFIAGGFCGEWYLENTLPCDAILRAVREVCQENHGAFVETGGLLSNNQKCGNNDPIHFCRESAHILGSRYFAAFEKL